MLPKWWLFSSVLVVCIEAEQRKIKFVVIEWSRGGGGQQ
jgi:hypothetical protein